MVFKRVKGKECIDKGFASCDDIVDSSLVICDKCGGKKRKVEAIDKRIVAALSLAIAVSIAGFTYLALNVKTYLAEEPDQSSRQATRPVDESSHRGITDLFRSIYSDGIKTVEEQAEIDNLARRQAVDPVWLVQKEKEIKDRSESASSSLRKGLIYAAQQDYRQAAREFKRGAEIDPDNSFLWANLAAAHIKLSEMDEAQSACQKAIALDSQNWLAHYNLGALNANRGDKDSAIRELSEALRLVTEDRARQVSTSEVTDYMKADQSLNSLRNDPRFLQLLARN
jgi:tetratricopeptide (TPR) repeat protein